MVDPPISKSLGWESIEGLKSPLEFKMEIKEGAGEGTKEGDEMMSVGEGILRACEVYFLR